jgi:hypothetical protein
VSESLHPLAPHHLPGFISGPGDTDVLMIVVGFVLIGAIVAVGKIGLFLAMVDLPDFGTPLRRIAGSVEKMAGVPPVPDPTERPDEAATHAAGAPAGPKSGVAKREAQVHA